MGSFDDSIMRKLLLLIPLLLCASTARTQTLIASGTCSGLNSCTTSAINTTGANFIVITVSYYTGATTPTISDSQASSSNSYTALTLYQAVALGCRIFYSTPTHVGTGHTFSFSGTGAALTLNVSAWSGMATSSVFQSGTDKGGGAAATNLIQPGSSTPSGRTLLITGLAFAALGTVSIN